MCALRLYKEKRPARLFFFFSGWNAALNANCFFAWEARRAQSKCKCNQMRFWSQSEAVGLKSNKEKVISQGRTKCGDYIYFKWPITPSAHGGTYRWAFGFCSGEAITCYSGHVGQQPSFVDILRDVGCDFFFPLNFLLPFVFHLRREESSRRVIWWHGVWCDGRWCGMMGRWIKHKLW